MTAVIRFTTRRFDISKEPENPINPIAGASLLWWFREKLAPHHDLPEPEAEDWGWYSNLEWNGRSYLIGACVNHEEGEEPEWLLQIEKHRSFGEKLFGKNKMTDRDDCLAHLLQLLTSEPTFSDVALI